MDSRTLQKIAFVDLDTRFLESFLSVVESGSMTEAARLQGLRPRAEHPGSGRLRVRSRAIAPQAPRAPEAVRPGARVERRAVGVRRGLGAPSPHGSRQASAGPLAGTWA